MKKKITRYKSILTTKEASKKILLNSFASITATGSLPIMPILDSITLNNGQMVDFIPQGLCLIEEDILLSAYPKCRRHIFGFLNKNKCDDDLFAIIVRTDKSGVVKHIWQLPFDSHVGGICFDKENIWVCSGGHKITAFSYKKIVELEKNNSESCVDVSSALVYEFETGGRTSFCAWNSLDSRLWTGSYSNPPAYDVEAKAFAYDVDANVTSHNQKEEISIIPKVQGMCFFRYKGEDYAALSQSGSSLFVYTYKDFIEQRLDDFIMNISMPAMLEQIEEKEGELYLLFESTGRHYRKWYMPVVDRIWKLNVGKLIEKNEI